MLFHMEIERYIAEAASNVARRIEDSGQNPHQIALGTGIAYNTLTRRLQRPSTFRVSELLLISRYLEARPEDFFRGVAA